MHSGSWSEEASMLSNCQETLTISSGSLVLLDQFMLGNQQFFTFLDNSGIETAVGRFGGVIAELPNGTYRVYRDHLEQLIVVFLEPEEGLNEDNLYDIVEHVSAARMGCKAEGRVFVETRCLVLFDKVLLENKPILEQFAEMRRRREEKQSRDFLRDQGAAVRYGFERNGDVLVAERMDKGDLPVLALWPVATQVTE
ncbi:MAG: hypothetical protein PHC51_00160 [bacterium]|nr:hypothetical protein [bacterium]